MKYRFSIGLLLRLRSGYQRIIKRNLCPYLPYYCLLTNKELHNTEDDKDIGKYIKRIKVLYKYITKPIVLPDTEIYRFYMLVRYFTCDKDLILLNHCSPEELFDTEWELSRKCLTLSSKLAKDYFQHILYPRDITTKQLVFKKSLLRKIQQYHNEVRRPSGTYEDSDTILNSSSYLKPLLELPKDRCLICSSKRTIYCGKCYGERLRVSDGILPNRIILPFDIILAVHYQESLHECTGIHSRVLCQPENIQVIHWPRVLRGGNLSEVIESFDPQRDVLLFPSTNAINAIDFPWTSTNTTTNTTNSNDVNTRKRLIVLEASWNHGKVMANQIINYRKDNNLIPLPCIRLDNIIGEFWKFHEYGHSSVSTIEAIAYTAKVAGLTNDLIQNMLLLFRLQKYRVLKAMELGDHKPPQAICVEGSDVGSWKECIENMDTLFIPET